LEEEKADGLRTGREAGEEGAGREREAREKKKGKWRLCTQAVV
jgi:hypothetical protein